MRSDRFLSFLQLRWLGQGRILAYSRILMLGGLASMVWAYGEATGKGGSDFMAFWSAGRLAVMGAAGKVYDISATLAVQAGLGRIGIAQTSTHHLFAFVNPPPFLLVVAPLGLMTYPHALIVWVVATYAFWLAMTRRLAPELGWPIAASPAALMAAWHAQTGFFVSGLQAMVAGLLERRPFMAGLAIGGLIVKPHLALLIPVALVAGRQWRAFAGAVVSVLGLMLLTWAVFGSDAILNYRESWAVSRSLMDTGGADFFLRQTTVYAAVRVSFPPLAASIAQGVATLAMGAMTWRAWSAPGPMEGKIALLMAATPLATPYLFSYDLPFTIIPLCWLLREERQVPGGGWMRLVLLFFYIAPFATRGLAMPLGANLMPWVSCGMLWCVWRRLPVQPLPALWRRRR